MIFFKPITLVITAFLLTVPNLIRGQNTNTLSADQWQEDLNYLVEEIEKTVPGFKYSETHDQYEALIKELQQNFSLYTENQIIIALQEILNTIQDEGCRIYPFQERLNYKILPLKSYWFDDGVFICDANSTYKHLIGKKVTLVNGNPIDSVFIELQNTLNADNIFYQKQLFPAYMQVPEWLNGKGLGENTDEIILSFEDGQTEIVAAEDVAEYIKLNRNLAGKKKLTPGVATTENFWMEYIPEQKVLIVQFLRIDKDQNGKTFKKFTGEVKKELENRNIDKLVIDNRYGGGGNGFKLKPFTDMIRDHKGINQRGKLFILTSRTTRGTILELTSILELNTEAIIIGEATGEGPNSVGDGVSIELPNSLIQVSLTKKFWPTSWPEDKRLYVSPNIVVAYSFQDYKTNTDPWMNKVFDYKQTYPPVTNIPVKIQKDLKGDFMIQDRQVEISMMDNDLYMSMDRKMASFFEFYTKLYFDKPGRLSTDIENVYLHYNTSTEGKYTVTHISWQGVELK